MANQLYQWKLMSTGLAGNPKIVRENDIKKDLIITKINNWTKYMKNRIK